MSALQTAQWPSRPLESPKPERTPLVPEIRGPRTRSAAEASKA